MYFVSAGCGEDIGQRDRRGPGSKSRPLFAVSKVFLRNVTRQLEPGVRNRPNRLRKRNFFGIDPLGLQISKRLPSKTAATLPLRRLFTKLRVEPANAPMNSSQ